MSEPIPPRSLHDRLPEPVRALLRAASWHRRLLAAGCAAAAVAFAIGALAPPPPPTVRVLAAARDVATGMTLDAADVQVVGLPPSLVPDGALRPGVDVVGRVAAAPLRRGEPVTDVRLLGNSLLDGLGNGLVATPVRLADPGAARLLQPGQLVDVLAASTRDGDGSGRAPVVAGAVRVVTVPDPADSGAGLGEGALVVLATTPSTAAALATAAVTARLSVTIRAG